MMPLIGAICGSKEDLAMYLLRLPGQVPGLNRCIDGVQSKELVRQGADMDLCDVFSHTPLCAAAPTWLPIPWEKMKKVVTDLEEC